jgi:hypothetical protein
MTPHDIRHAYHNRYRPEIVGPETIEELVQEVRDHKNSQRHVFLVTFPALVALLQLYLVSWLGSFILS